MMGISCFPGEIFEIEIGHMEIAQICVALERLASAILCEPRLRDEVETEQKIQ